MGIPIPVELDRCTPAVVGGLFNGGACPLPDGWERGVSFQDTACLLPTVMGECPTCPDLKPTQRATTETFRPVSLIAALECSTFGGIDVPVVASQTLDETASYALAREMLTGEASLRDANPNTVGPIGNPSLQSTATIVGDGSQGPVGTLGCLEQAIADATGGRVGTILLGPALVVYLGQNGLLHNEGDFGLPTPQRGLLRTLSGNRVIVSGGFDGRAPFADDSPGSPGDPCVPWNSTGAPVHGDQLYMYATAGVWAGVGPGRTLSDVNRADNTASAREERPALIAFTPCATFAAPTGIANPC
jgi:hypothetical protein